MTNRVEDLHLLRVLVRDMSIELARLKDREDRASELLTDVRFCGRVGLHSDIDKWLAGHNR